MSRAQRRFGRFENAPKRFRALQAVLRGLLLLVCGGSLALSVGGCAGIRENASSSAQASPSPLKEEYHARQHTLSRPRLFFILERGATNRREVALTFDDGPHPEFLPRLLERLQTLGVKATFFVVGEKVDEAPELAKRIVESGHEIANHSYSHPNLKRIPSEQVEEEIVKGNEAIRNACGVEPLFFRPPGGNYDDDTLRALHHVGMAMGLWTFNPKDFLYPPANETEAGILKHMEPGAIILLHSGVETTFAMLPSLVAKLKKQGYRFVTLTEMAKHAPDTAETMQRYEDLQRR